MLGNFYILVDKYLFEITAQISSVTRLWKSLSQIRTVEETNFSRLRLRSVSLIPLAEETSSFLVRISKQGREGWVNQLHSSWVALAPVPRAIW